MRFLACFIILLFPVGVFAAPSVSTVGAFSHGSTVTISGSSFGTRVTGAGNTQLRWDDFETGTVGHDVTTDFTYWSKRSTDSIPISNAKTRGNSTKSAYQYLRAGTDSNDTNAQASILYSNNIGFSTTKKIFISYWTYWDWGTFDQPGGTNVYYSQIKELNVCPSINSSGVHTYPSFEYIHYMYDTNTTPYGHIYLQDYYGAGLGAYNVEVRDASNNWITSADRPAGWYQVQIQSYMGTAGSADGSIKIWRTRPSMSGAYYANSATNIQVIPAGGSDINAVKFGWYRGYTSQGESYIYHDDIYMDNSWARVEIGDNATYDSCTHREIQPLQSWGASSISITANQGSFANGSQVYVFVVDENGDPSSGYGPITVGAAQGSLRPGVTAAGVMIR